MILWEDYLWAQSPYRTGEFLRFSPCYLYSNSLLELFAHRVSYAFYSSASSNTSPSILRPFSPARFTFRGAAFAHSWFNWPFGGLSGVFLGVLGFSRLGSTVLHFLPLFHLHSLDYRLLPFVLNDLQTAMFPFSFFFGKGLTFLSLCFLLLEFWSPVLRFLFHCYRSIVSSSQSL